MAKDVEGFQAQEDENASYSSQLLLNRVEKLKIWAREFHKTESVAYINKMVLMIRLFSRQSNNGR